MKISRLLLLWFFVVGTINAQQKATEVIRLFGTNTSVQWNVPIEGKSILLNWQARPNSLAQEGFRTFVAYHNGNFAGTLSMNKTTLSGEVWQNGHSYFINTENGILKVTTDKEHFTCGTCADGQCFQATTPTSQRLPMQIVPTNAMTARGAILHEEALPSDDKRVLYNTNVLRTYRLAMLIDYSFYKERCYGDINKVKEFMTKVEAGLNEVCGREIGCQFTLVNDPRLIITTKDKEVYDRPVVREVVDGVYRRK